MQKEELVLLIGQGLTQKQIADRLNVSKRTIQKRLEEYSLKTSSRKNFYGNNAEVYTRARELREQGYGYRTICSMLDNAVAWRTIANWVSDIKVDPEKSYTLSQETRRIPIRELKSKSAIRHRLIELRGNKCEWCGVDSWHGKPIVLEMHRLKGKGSSYSDIDNVVLVCPNCHSTTDDYKNKNPAHGVK